MLYRFFRDESGQGITEYGAIIAFVAIIIACVFTFTKGSLAAAISHAFSAITSQLNNMSSTANNASS